MSKKKYPSQLNTRQVRVNIGDYALLKEISIRAGISMAKALHLAIERQEQITSVSPAQIPMSVFQVSSLINITENGADTDEKFVDVGKNRKNNKLEERNKTNGKYFKNKKRLPGMSNKNPAGKNHCVLKNMSEM